MSGFGERSGPAFGRTPHFGRAISAELSAVRAAPASEIELVDGRRVSREGGFRYVFAAASAVRGLQDGVDAALVFPDARRLDVRVVSVEGQQIRLSSKEDLGHTIARAQLQADAGFLLQKLSERLASIDAGHRLGQLLLGRTAPRGEPAETQDSSLNSEQLTAMQSALGRELTVIWGPPGTGKTRTIGAIAAHAHAQGERVLLVSHTNVALDGAVLSVAAHPLFSSRAGVLLRAGVPRMLELAERRELLASTLVEDAIEGLRERRDSAEQELAPLRESVRDFETVRVLADWHGRLHRERRAVERRLEQELPRAMALAADHRRRANEAGDDKGRRWYGEKASDTEREARVIRREIQSQLLELLEVPRIYGLVPASHAEEVEALLSRVDDAGVGAARLLAEHASEGAREQANAQRRVHALEAVVASVNEEIRRAEEDVLSDASIVAATLTAAFARGAITRQRFDLIIVDEASIAGFPALWAAAALGTRMVVVGDYQQLSPICRSDEPAAIKWLARDVFEIAGWRAASESGAPPAFLIQLLEQQRMAPQIARIPNLLAYRGRLRDGARTGSDLLSDFGSSQLIEQGAVEVVDISSVHPWAANPADAFRASRANPISAATSLLLAERSLSPSRKPHLAGDDARVLIVSPYRAQAELLERMIIAKGMGGEIVAGTVHAFQGSEAPVVILDLTIAPPHHRAAIFAPDFNDAMLRLLNVGVSRAMRRLLIVTTAAWTKSQAGKGTPLKKLMEHLDRSVRPRNARVIWKNAAAAGCEGWLEDATQEVGDAIDAAADRVVVFSPALSRSVAASFAPRIVAAVGRGTTVLVVTTPDRELDRPTPEAVSLLQSAGAVVMRKRALNESLVLVDERCAFLTSNGPLAPGGPGPTAMVTERRSVREMASLLHLDKLVEDLDRDGRRCGRCGSELELSEGSNQMRARYWRCPRCAPEARESYRR